MFPSAHPVCLCEVNWCVVHPQDTPHASNLHPHADTEAYINRLSEKIAAVKLSAEVSNAQALAMAEARKAGLSEEEVQVCAAHPPN
jgi:hypothetical protein